MSTSELASTARALVAAGKGLLAADARTGTIGRRFGAVGIETTRHAPPELPADALHHPAALAHFGRAGVDLPALATRLQVQGAVPFVASWKELMASIALKSAALTTTI